MKNCVAYNVEQQEEMREDVLFRHGIQWNDTDLRDRQQKGRPALTFNRMESFIDSIVGDLKENKISIKVRPTDGIENIVVSENGTEYNIASFIEGVIRNIENKTDADTAYTTAFDNAVGHGEGYFALATRYVDDDSFNQEIYFRRIINSFAVYFDPNSTELDGSDARYAFISSWVDREELEQSYPNIDFSDTLDRKQWDDANVWSNQDGKVRIVEYYRKVQVNKRKIIRFSDGDVLEESEKEQIALKTQQGIEITGERYIYDDKVEWYLTDGVNMLTEPTVFPSKYIPIIPVYGKELVVDGRIWRRGVIRHAKDAQRLYNFERTAAVERVALSPKAPFIAAAQQIKGFEKVWKTANIENHAVLPYNHVSGIPAPRREGYTMPASGEAQEAMMAVDDMKATTGIFDASLGNRSNEVSGRAILARQRRGDLVNYTFLDNLQKSVRHAGRIIIDMLPKVYDTRRVIRILNVDETDDIVNVNLAELLENVKFDVAVTTGLSYATRRMESADSMMQFIQAVPQAGQAIMDLVAETMDWAGADKIAKRLKKLLPPELQENEGKDDEQQQAMQQAELAMQQQQAELQMQMAQEQIKLQEAQAKAMKAEADAEKAKAQALEAQAELKQKMQQASGETIAEMTPEELAMLIASTVEQMLNNEEMQEDIQEDMQERMEDMMENADDEAV